mmetsp:Transcript_29173/g.51596  ORF Transcript_29173/g.51596 Transcript_29173/m.51596 type:complete len:217 (+) Transcript_29173:367-1017(+)
MGAAVSTAGAAIVYVGAAVTTGAAAVYVGGMTTVSTIGAGASSRGDASATGAATAGCTCFFTLRELFFFFFCTRRAAKKDAQHIQQRSRPTIQSQAVPVPLSIELLAPLGKEAKELLWDEPALLELSAGGAVVASAFGAGSPPAAAFAIAASAAASPPGKAASAFAASAAATCFSFASFFTAMTPATVPPIAAAPATPTSGPHIAALLSFLTGAHG